MGVLPLPLKQQQQQHGNRREKKPKNLSFVGVKDEEEKTKCSSLFNHPESHTYIHDHYINVAKPTSRLTDWLYSTTLLQHGVLTRL